MENEIIKGGQGRALDNRDGWILWALALSAFLIGLCSCGAERRAEFSEDCPSGDLLPAPIQAQLRECMLRSVAYAKAQGTNLEREGLPDLVVCKDEKELIKATNGKAISGKRLVGRCWYSQKTIFIIGNDHETLYHELGHWFFGTSEEVADNFSAYCMKKDAELEQGLTRILNGNDKGE